MYGIIKKGSKGDDVKLLCRLLNTTERNIFDDSLDKIVREFQSSNSLVSDGIVGWNTWKILVMKKRESDNGKVSEEDYNTFANLLGIEAATLKAVVKVETGGRSGFMTLSDGSKVPQVLFEAHIFYKQLKNIGLDPSSLMRKYPNLISKSWNKSLYKGGTKEWTRLQEAMKINKKAALMSASYGLFQCMGFNYKSCGCSGVEEFFDKMCESEYQQLVLGIEFIRTSGLVKYLKIKNWAGFARGYNGPGYAKNRYDKKLEEAYKLYKK